MSVSNFKNRGKKIGHVSHAGEPDIRDQNDQQKEVSVLPIAEELKKINLESVGSDGKILPDAGLYFGKIAKVSKDNKTKTSNHFGSINQTDAAHFRLDQITKHILDGTFAHVVETITQPKFITESYAKADAAGKADIKVLAAVAIAAHGEEIAQGLRKNDGIKDVKNIPEHHIADVMKMSMQFGASQRSMNAFMNILHEAGKLPAVIEHLFKNAKSSDLINITSSIVKLGLDPTPLTCAQTAFRLMAYALNHAGIQKESQPTLFKVVSTMARGFQLGSNVLEAAGNVVGVTMMAQVSGFLIQKMRDYAMRQQVQAQKTKDRESMQFAQDIEKMQQDYEAQSESQRAANFNKKEDECSNTRQQVKEAIILSYQSRANESRGNEGVER